MWMYLTYPSVQRPEVVDYEDSHDPHSAHDLH